MIQESQVIILKKYCAVFLSLKIHFVFKQTVQTLMKGHIVHHFIWVFTVCLSTGLGVSNLQRIKIKFNICKILNLNGKLCGLWQDAQVKINTIFECKIVNNPYPPVFTYVLGAQKNRLIETVLLSTQT